MIYDVNVFSSSCVFKFSEREEEVRVHEAGLPVNDSESEDSGDSQGGGSVSSSSSSSSEDEDDNNDVPLGDTWDQGSDFKPMEPNPRERFEEHPLHFVWTKSTAANGTSMQSNKCKHTSQGMERNLQDYLVGQDSSIYK
jgi:hypothetical protein